MKNEEGANIPPYKKEWLDSQIDPSIVDLNVKFVTGDLAYEHLLYGLDSTERRNDGRLRDKWIKTYSHLGDGGWWCSGVDLLTFKPSQWGCFKPDKPRKIEEIKGGRKKNKIIKYEHPPHTPTEIFALRISPEIRERIAAKNPQLGNHREFWQAVLDSPVPILITEGAKKAGCILTAGYVAIALPGIWSGYRRESQSLIPLLQCLARPGREIIFVFDQDTNPLTRHNVSLAIKRTGEIFRDDLDCLVSILEWSALDGKGIDDLVPKFGTEIVDKLFENRIGLSEYLLAKGETKVIKSKSVLLDFLLLHFADRLAYNELTYRIELDGKLLELSTELAFYLIEEYGVEASGELIMDSFSYLAKKNSYHPVRHYLEKCHYNAIASNIDNLADRYLGTVDPLYNVFVKKWLIAAVARIFEPGCKVDFALILQGAQGIRKSGFFRALGGKWFDDSFGPNVESNKSLLVLHKSWIQEWAEFDRVTSKGDFDVIKAFLTRQIDCFVKPYGRDAIDYPRQNVLCGSVNKDSFLRDVTGDRRFLVIPVPQGHYINTDDLQKERDAIWAAATFAYLEGKAKGENAWNLSLEEYQGLEESNEIFRVSDEWEYSIAAFLEDKEQVSIAQILGDRFGIEEKDQDRRQQMRVAEILTKLGWNKSGERKEGSGKRRKFWEKKIDTTYPLNRGGSVKVVLEVVSAPNPDTVKVSEEATLPTLPPDPKNFLFRQQENLMDSQHDSNPFRAGDWVEYEGGIYQVESSSRYHVRLIGSVDQVNAFFCTPASKRDYNGRKKP
jgi:hypothetical protein